MILVSLIIGSIFFHDNTAAISPRLSLHEIRDGGQDWIDLVGSKNPINNGSNYTDIKAVSYLSDGKFLNSTFRLFSPLYNNTDYNPREVYIDQIIYGMLIDADYNKATGLGGVEYMLEISKGFPFQNSWIQRL